MEKHMSNLRNNIKVIRHRLQISQEKLALLSGLSQQTINNIENGETPVKTSSVLSIAKAFDVHPQYLWGDKVPDNLPIHSYEVGSAQVVIYKPTESSPPIAYSLHDADAFYNGYTAKNYCRYSLYTYPMWHPLFGYIEEYGICAMRRNTGGDLIFTCLNISEREGVVKMLAETFTNNGVSICHFFDMIQDMKRGMFSFTSW